MKTSNHIIVYDWISTVNAVVSPAGDGERQGCDYARPVDENKFAAVIHLNGSVTIWVPCCRPNRSWGWNTIITKTYDVYPVDVPGIFGGPGYRKPGQQSPPELKDSIEAILQTVSAERREYQAFGEAIAECVGDREVLAGLLRHRAELVAVTRALCAAEAAGD